MSDDLPSSRKPNRRSRWWSRLFGRYASNGMARSDIVEFLGRCRRVNLLDTDEHAMLQGVLKVSETQVRDIMVPRSHMVVLELDDPPQAMLKTIVESGHSRFPVVGEDRDEVAGIMLAKDLLRYFGEDHPSDAFRIGDLLRKAIYIPESKRLDTLLTEFRESHNHMAIVVDEYGGVAGLATIEDVIEQIVGDIDDEHDPEEAEYIHDHGEGRFTVLAPDTHRGLLRALRRGYRERRIRHGGGAGHAQAGPPAAARRGAGVRRPSLLREGRGPQADPVAGGHHDSGGPGAVALRRTGR